MVTSGSRASSIWATSTARSASSRRTWFGAATAASSSWGVNPARRRAAVRSRSRRCSVADAARRARVEELLDAARVLADPKSAAGQRLRARLEQTTGLSRPSIEFSLEHCLEQRASEQELARLLARVPEAPRALVLLSANVFVAPLRAIALARASSARVVVRASRRDPALTE